MTLYLTTFYSCLAGFGEVLAQWLFFSGLLGKKASPLRFLPLFLLSCAGISLTIPVPCKFLLLAALLFLYGTAFCGKRAGYSLFSALLAVELTQVCYGVFQPLLPFLAFLLFPASPALYGTLCMLAGDFFALGLAFLCGRAILRQPSQWVTAQDMPLPAAVPFLLILLVSGGIAHSVYGNIVTISPSGPAPSLLHLPLLLIQLLSIASMFCILHTYRKASALAALNRFHAKYAAETQARWNRTDSLRHDIKNHISVARGLLEKGDAASAAAYLAALDTAAAGLSAPFRTNRPACDVLLAEKAAHAENLGIAFHGALLIPDACAVEDMHLCTLLANALDNAIHACQKLPPGTEKFIRISSHIQGDFLLLMVENSFCGSPHIRPGTGLRNIRQTVKKYGGRAEASATDTVFRLSMLLSISQRPSRISRHSH